ncbi:hypothetical protein GCM10012275_30440 [Longimycelium tulufanense]|uniref:Secreted protein n=1 Tax=Longimycelium tulufanense TaxID=907463 RepID=A0A8J3FUB6_9PSEU|nr:hypothetical protein [Longimycelium tulufanense]GGM57252.1 hypothetical protein GCM10012275_30440 [Longimycelium tulufanense]
MAQRVRRWVAVVAATGAALGFAVPGAHAAERSSDGDTYCDVVYGRAPAPEADSPLLFRTCAGSEAESKARVMAWFGRQRAAGLAPGDPVTMMYWYEHINYNRDARGDMTRIWGNDGPCDSAGYRVEPNSEWAGKLSSILGDSGCTEMTIYNRALTHRREGWSIRYQSPVGMYLHEFNDNVGRIQAHA